MPKTSTPRRLCGLAVISAALAMRRSRSPRPPAMPRPSRPRTQMNKMDTNKDGQVSKDEFMKSMEKKFDAMDKNKNKMLSKDEWLQQQLEEGSGGGG